MNNMLQLVETRRDVHVLYSYEEAQSYIEQVVAYTKHGIQAGEHIILIENPRMSPKIHKQLKNELSNEQMKLVHFVKSFDFYFSSGSYHPPAIQAYFEKILKPLLEEQARFRAWAHVEWASNEIPMHLIEDLEKIIDVAVKDHDFPLICAYANQLLPDTLKTLLLETHPYVLVEDDVVVSEQYIATQV